MKFNFLLKVSPFLSTLLLIFFLSISNQKEYTKLKILIWNTPSLTLGTYLAISTGMGFLFSYLTTFSIAKINQSQLNESLKFKDDNIFEESNDFLETNTNLSYDNTLIERDIKDPSPTINASFRVIGKTERSKSNSIDKNHSQYEQSIEYEKQYDYQPVNNQTFNDDNSGFNDWNDESFSKW